MKIYTPIAITCNGDSPDENNVVVIGHFETEEAAEKALNTYKECQLAGEFGYDSWDECEENLESMNIAVSFETIKAELGEDINYTFNTYEIC